MVINPLNLAVAPLSANSPSPFVQRPKDMESLLANFSLLILVAINSIGTLVWRKYENYIIVRFSHFFIHDKFFSSMLPNEMAMYPNWLILFVNKIVLPMVMLVIAALTILLKYGRDLQREFWTYFKISNCFNITRKTNIVCVSNLYMQSPS